MLRFLVAMWSPMSPSDSPMIERLDQKNRVNK